MDRRIPLILLLFVGVQCTGTETENPAAPLVSFHASECKTELSTTTAATSAPDGGRLENHVSPPVSFDKSYDGLQCIAWQKLGFDTLRFDLGNFHASCGIDWKKGSASVAQDGTVALHAINSDCRVAACGWCMYDWSFDVRSVPQDQDARLLISVVDDKGNRCDSTRAPDATTIPTSTSEQGIVCRPAFRYAVDDQARKLGTTGNLHMPCDPGAPTSCASELSCGPLASTDDLRCLARCSADSDCPLPGILTCQEETCRLAQTW